MLKRIIALTGLLVLLAGLFLANGVQAQGETEIDVWIYQSFYENEEDSAIVKATEKFMEENPNIKVNLIPTVYGSGSYRDKFIRVSRGGGGPDVIMNDIIWVPQMAAMEIIQPVGDMMGDKKNEFFETPLKAATHEDKIYGVPYHTNALGYFYNKDLFRKAGLDPEDPPDTWSEFRAAANLITKETDSHGFGYMGHWGGSFEWFSPFWAFGANVLEDNMKEAALNSPQGKVATEFWINMVTQDGVVPKASSTWKSWEEIASGFATETVGMVFGFQNVYMKLENKSFDFDYGIAKLPKGRAGRASILGGGHLCINANSENTEAAYKWIDYMTSVETLNVFDESKRTSARKDAIEHQEFLKNNKKIEPLFESLEFAQPRPPIPKWTQVDYDTIQPEFMKILHEGKSVNDALNDAAKNIDELLAE